MDLQNKMIPTGRSSDGQAESLMNKPKQQNASRRRDEPALGRSPAPMKAKFTA